MRRLVRASVLLVVLHATSSAAAQRPHDVVPPVVAHHVDAVYPPSALSARAHADVVLVVTVDVDGHVSTTDVVESGGADLDEAAIVAAREWTFVPAMRDGKPVASRIKMPFHFAPPASPPELVETPTPPDETPMHDAVPTAAAAPSRANERQEPEEVEVTGRARSPARGGGDFALPIGKLAVVPRANAADFLKLAPGIIITNEGGEGHADSMVLRGFDAGEGESIALSVGGVPLNDPGNFHVNGYADSHFILPELVESVRVIEGPFDPHQGNFGVAGSADYELGLARRGLTAKWTAGSYGTERLLLAWGPADHGPHTFAAAEYAQSDGYGVNRAFQRGSALAQVDGKLGERGTWRVTGQAYSVVGQSAGVVREADYEAGRIGFYGTYDRNQGQDLQRFSLSADLETRSRDTTLTQQVFIIDRSLRIREDFLGYVDDAGAPAPRGHALDLAVKQQTFGVRGSARTTVDAFHLRQELEIGYFARGDTVDNVQRIVDRATQVPYATNASLGGFLGNLALYVDASVKPTAWATLRGGVREELFTYVIEDHCPATSDCMADPAAGKHNARTSVANSEGLPRASLLLGPFDGFTFVGSYGRGARSLAIDEVAADPTTPLATISSYEGGASYGHTTRAGELTLRSVFFDTEIDRDQVLDIAQGRTVATGATRRTGWVGASRFTGRFFDEAASVAAVRGVFDAAHQGIPYVPHVTARSDTAFFADLPWALGGHLIRASLGPAVTYVGAKSLPLGQTSDPYVLIDAALNLHWRGFELGLIATNLLDTKYRLSEFTFVSDFRTQPRPSLTPERSFTAGPPRMVFLSLSATLGG